MKKLPLHLRKLKNGKQCHYCHIKKAKTLDHKIPVSKGGEDTPENLVPCCFVCNHERGSEISYELFVRFTRRFGGPDTGWYKSTMKYKINASKMILKNLAQNIALEIISEKYPYDYERIVRRLKL